MDYNLDRQLRLLLEPEHKSLYSWAIQEIDDAGKQVGPDQIPWGWRQYFTATEVFLSDTLTLKEAGEIEGRLPQREEISHRRIIRAKLRAGDPRSDDWFRRTKFRMFGTDREITEFQLEILPLETEEAKEECKAWGGVSFESNADFRRDHFDDNLTFYLMVKPSTFDLYGRRIAEGTADEMILSVGRVAGFYSEWSPDIHTRDVKVLTQGDAQKIETPAGTEYDLPRLGDVGEAELYINAKRAQAQKLPSDEDADEVQTTPLVRPEADTRSGGLDPQLQKTLQSLKSSARWIIGLLAVLVIAVLLKR
jgi:hypothetical protein